MEEVKNIEMKEFAQVTQLRITEPGFNPWALFPTVLPGAGGRLKELGVGGVCSLSRAGGAAAVSLEHGGTRARFASCCHEV